MTSTVHRGGLCVMMMRNTKVNGQHTQLQIRQPVCIRDYKQRMGGADTFDQRVASYRVLRRARKIWRSLFLDFIDVAVVNCYKMFPLWRLQHPGVIDSTDQ